jgi:hypothetical protein
VPVERHAQCGVFVSNAGLTKAGYEMGASESRSGRGHHPCGDGGQEESRRKRGKRARERPLPGSERDWLVWPHASQKGAGEDNSPPTPVTDQLCVDNAFAIGVFDSPTPDAKRVGELYKGQVVAGVAEWHTRVGRGPLGLNLGCSQEDTWMRLASQSLPWVEGTPTELWVHMEHRRASCCDGVQSQVYLIEAPRKAPPPLPGSEPEPEPEPQLFQRTSLRQAQRDEAEPLAAAIDRSSLDLLRVSASSIEAMQPLASEIDRSSLDVLRVSASSMEAMRLSNSSSRSSLEPDATEVGVEAEGGSEAHGTSHGAGTSTSAAELRNKCQQQEQDARPCKAAEDGDELRALRKQLKTAEAIESDARP